MRVGIFDSGIGGINVLSCFLRKYPMNEYIYFGDTKNLPYGDKSKDELFDLACNAIDFLITQKVDLIIIACGTISSNCYNRLREKYSLPIYDIISPTVDYLQSKEIDNIGIIGTNKTIESNVFNLPAKKIKMLATPSFVPIIENNLINEKEKEIIHTLRPLSNCNIIVLGCTHYPLLKKLIETKMKINTLDMGEVLVNKIKLSNNDVFSCNLFFSEISVNLIKNIEKIINCDYQISLK